VKGLELDAILGEVEASIGQYAIDVKDDQTDLSRLMQDVLPIERDHGCLRHASPQQIMHVEDAQELT
jgi:hypothetical protein